LSTKFKDNDLIDGPESRTACRESSSGSNEELEVVWTKDGIVKFNVIPVANRSIIARVGCKLIKWFKFFKII
jgi:hypothetical protein